MENHRFDILMNKIELYVEEHAVGSITYSREKDVIVATYIYVEPEERGKGYAGQLINELIRFAGENKSKIKAVCPVIKRNLEEHQSDILTDEI
ncbi:GNAT family N-acetyltransferase [Haloplasma contractile]|uniref:Gcn5-related N-acetyltransferase protein n=1 Tax=Haloplasma contractile SSD-17B TaxID=1033810 RepID=U2EF16_9MOLU|nr:GNAT family N-acetyltransferase [Haloplasma contractile]ERJ13518.1 gcn5-related N-acetyltransferase protein [Haloplasma contractile SSD-17B]